MFQPAIQYKPRVKNVGGSPSYMPATYRRLSASYATVRDAAEAAIDFHSRYVHRAVTTPVVVCGRSADGSFRFEFARRHVGEAS